jgi:hypothetical protein
MGKPVSYARIYLNPQFHLKKSLLTIKPASLITLGIGSVYLMPRYVGPEMIPVGNWGRTKVERRQLSHELKNKVVFRP